jgi:hypothetical protein
MTNAEINKQLVKAQQNADKDQSRDLGLIICNDANIYKQSIQPTIKSIQKKIKKGVFDETQCIQAFYNVVLSALKNPQFNRYYTYNIQMVSVPTRYWTAVYIAEHFEDELWDFTVEA